MILPLTIDDRTIRARKFAAQIMAIIGDCVSDKDGTSSCLIDAAYRADVQITPARTAGRIEYLEATEANEISRLKRVLREARRFAENDPAALTAEPLLIQINEALHVPVQQTADLPFHEETMSGLDSLTIRSPVGQTPERGK